MGSPGFVKIKKKSWKGLDIIYIYILQNLYIVKPGFPIMRCLWSEVCYLFCNKFFLQFAYFILTF